jgi:hypothetical protein
MKILIQPPEPAAPIASCPGYYATTSGKIWSAHSGKWKSQQLNPYGYYVVKLAPEGWDKANPTTRQVARLVLEAYVGPPPSLKHQANHKNGVKTDNSLFNLEWLTPAQNVQHSYDQLGRKQKGQRGSKNPQSKLTEDVVRQIKVDLALGTIRQSVIARKYGTSPMTVSLIANGKAWTHI